jgi:hypothetical protein
MILKPGDVLCLRVPQEVRGVNGRLTHPPETLSLEPIGFETLKALDFEKYERIGNALKAARDLDPPVLAPLPPAPAGHDFDDPRSRLTRNDDGPRVSINTDDAPALWPAGFSIR